MSTMIVDVLAELEVGASGRIESRPEPGAVAQAVTLWLAHARHATDARVLSCTDLKGGLETWTYLLQVDGAHWSSDRVVLRIRRWPDSVAAVDAERAALQWAERQGVNAPAFLDREVSTDSALRHPFVVETFLPGTRFGQTWFIRGRRRRRWFGQLAALQADLHQRPLDGVDLPALSIDGGLTELEAIEAELGEADEGALEWMRHYQWVGEDPQRLSVLHLDFHPGNVLNNSGHLGVIDWSQARVGDPVADLARTLEVLGFGALIVGLRSARRFCPALALVPARAARTASILSGDDLIRCIRYAPTARASGDPADVMIRC